MLSGIERISAIEIPTVRIAAPYHSFVPFPAIAAQSVEMFFYKLFCFLCVPEHGSELLQQLCFTAFSLAFDFFKAFLKLLYFLTLFGLRSPSPLPARALSVRYRDPVAAVIINLCREKVHLSPPAGDVRRVAAIPFVLFSCKFLSSEDKICTKKRA